MADSKREERIKEGIRYRVRQEYEKYHNPHTMRLNGKDFWLEQVVNKLGESFEKQLQSEAAKAYHRGVIDTSTSPETSKYINELIAKAEKRAYKQGWDSAGGEAMVTPDERDEDVRKAQEQLLNELQKLSDSEGFSMQGNLMLYKCWIDNFVDDKRKALLGQKERE